MFDLLKRVRVKVVACACLGNHIGPSAEPMQFNPVLPQPRDRVLENAVIEHNRRVRTACACLADCIDKAQLRATIRGQIFHQ